MEQSEQRPRAGTIDNPYFGVVVGTGFGGAVVACRLAQARAAARAADRSAPPRPILVLERGRRYSREDFGRLKLPDYLAPAASETSKRLPETARLFWENDQGLWDLRNLGELRLAQAAGYGGGSLIYANVHLRPPQQVFDDAKWKASCDGACACTQNGAAPPPYSRDGLRRYYDRVAAMLELSRIPLKEPPPKTRAMKKLATIAGGDDHFLYPPLAITFETPAGGRNRFRRPQSACTNCGNCTIGCQEGAKNTLDLNYLAVAEDLGVEVRTLSEVQTIRPLRDGGRELLRVSYVDHLTGASGQVVAEHVFVCAGAAGSTALLMRSGDPDKDEEAPLLAGGGNGEVPTDPLPSPAGLGASFFANGDNIAVSFGAKMPGEGKPPLAPTFGPTITAAIVHGGPNWFLLEDGGIPPSVMQALGALRSPLWGVRNRFAAPGQGQVGALAHGLDVLHAAHRYWLSDLQPSPTRAVSQAIRQLVPEALNRVAEDLASAATLAQGDITWIVNRTLEAVDAKLNWALRKAREWLVPNKEIYDPAKDATAARHPLTTELLASNRPMDYAFAALRFLLLGAPVDDATMLLLCMGPDHGGRLYWRGQRLRIKWELGPKNLELYDTQERLMRDAATKLGGELRTNPDWTLGRKPVTVHAQGGCGMAGNDRDGVTTPCGRLWTSPQVYVMDGAVFPSSVGVNPSSTIAAVAERNIELFIRSKMPDAGPDYLDVFIDDRGELTRVPVNPREDFDDSLRSVLPPAPAGVPSAQPVGLSWHEELGGKLVSPTVPRRVAVLDSLAAGPLAKGQVIDRGHFRSLERRARVLGGTQVVLKLDVSAPNLENLMRQNEPKMSVAGLLVIGQESIQIEEGQLRLDMADVPGGKRSTRVWVQPRRLTGMTYRLRGADVTMLGVKIIEDDPGIDFWNDLSTLYTKIVYRGKELAGVVRVHLPDFVTNQLRQMKVGGPELDDDIIKTWGFLRFGQFFFGSVRNAYSDWG